MKRGPLASHCGRSHLGKSHKKKDAGPFCAIFTHLPPSRHCKGWERTRDNQAANRTSTALLNPYNYHMNFFSPRCELSLKRFFFFLSPEYFYLPPAATIGMFKVEIFAWQNGLPLYGEKSVIRLTPKSLRSDYTNPG